jgi:hypothetical protein
MNAQITAEALMGFLLFLFFIIFMFAPTLSFVQTAQQINDSSQLSSSLCASSLNLGFLYSSSIYLNTPVKLSIFPVHLSSNIIFSQNSYAYTLCEGEGSVYVQNKKYVPH